METPENVEIKVTPKVTDSELDGMIGRAFIRIVRGIAYIVASLYVNLSPFVFIVGMLMLTIINTSNTMYPMQMTEHDLIALSHMVIFTCIGAIGTMFKYGSITDRFINWLNPFKKE